MVPTSDDTNEAKPRRTGIRRDLLALLAGLAVGAAVVFAVAPARAEPSGDAAVAIGAGMA